MEKKPGRPPVFTSPGELEEKINEYFAQFKIGECKDIPEWTDMCNFLDVTKDLMCDYAKKDGFSQPIKKAKQKCEAFIAKGIMKGQLNATGGIFNLKHNYGWKDRQELEHSGTIKQERVINGMTKESIAELLADE